MSREIKDDPVTFEEIRRLLWQIREDQRKRRRVIFCDPCWLPTIASVIEILGVGEEIKVQGDRDVPPGKIVVVDPNIAEHFLELWT